MTFKPPQRSWRLASFGPTHALRGAEAALLQAVGGVWGRTHFLHFGAPGAPDQPGDAAQVAQAHPGALQVVVLRHPAGAVAVVDRDAESLPAGALHQRRQVAMHMVEVGQVLEGCAVDIHVSSAWYG